MSFIPQELAPVELIVASFPIDEVTFFLAVLRGLTVLEPVAGFLRTPAWGISLRLQHSRRMWFGVKLCCIIRNFLCLQSQALSTNCGLEWLHLVG